MKKMLNVLTLVILSASTLPTVNLVLNTQIGNNLSFSINQNRQLQTPEIQNLSDVLIDRI